MVEVRNRFKRLDLRDRVPEELWMGVHDIVQKTGIKTIPKKKNAKKQNLKQSIHLNKHPLPTTQEKILHRDITRCSTPKSD